MTYNWNSVKIPSKISPCTIQEAVVELRFDTDVPPEAIFGVLYSKVSGIYPTIKKQPIMELPDTIRATDPGLIFQPHYQVYRDEKYAAMIGPRVVSLVSRKPYSGWSDFYPRIKELVGKVHDAGCVKKFTRLGLRYINHFDLNIFEKINLSVNMGGETFGSDKSAVRLSIAVDEFVNDLRISNNPVLPKKLPVGAKSVIDIDTFVSGEISDVVSTIDAAHLAEKKLFFSLLKSDFLKTFSPEYGS